MSDQEIKTFEIGTVLDGKWVILEFVGKGGMGEVYRAHQLNLKRDVAIKIISREWVRSLEGDSLEVSACLQRFRREVEVMAQIRHPNVIQIFDHGFVESLQAGGEASVEYMVMEYIPGSTLRSTMSDEGFHPEEDRVREWLTDFFLPLLEGVEALHEAGIVHRDLKPENVMLDRGKPKIADFGLARSCQLKAMTQSFDVKGTPAYMSPEHFMDLKRTDERADIYSLGKMLYEALVGKMGPDTIPFKSVRLPRAESPFFKELDRIIQKATAEERSERWSSVADFRQALTATLAQVQRESPKAWKMPRGRIQRWKALAVAATLLVTIGLLLFYRHERPHTGALPGSPLVGPLERSDTGAVLGDPSSSQPTDRTPSRVPGGDFDIMRLVSGGKVTLPRDFGEGVGETVVVKPFYLNETPITNQQYADFLNHVVDEIQVGENLVRSGQEIWLMLGEVTEGYEPIIFRDGRFHVKNASHSACPILRVTAYGALAYVKFYGLRLPTVEEFFFAVTEGASVPGDASPAPPGSSQGMMPMMHGTNQETSVSIGQMEFGLPLSTPVIMFEPNAFGIRQLNRNIGEWGIRTVNTAHSGKDPQAEYVVMGGPARGAGPESEKPQVVQRNPWEAFEEVGFRCAQDAS